MTSTVETRWQTARDGVIHLTGTIAALVDLKLYDKALITAAHSLIVPLYQAMVLLDPEKTEEFLGAELAKLVKPSEVSSEALGQFGNYL